MIQPTLNNRYYQEVSSKTGTKRLYNYLKNTTATYIRKCITMFRRLHEQCTVLFQSTSNLKVFILRLFLIIDIEITRSISWLINAYNFL
jgi:hypothetical protein